MRILTVNIGNPPPGATATGTDGTAYYDFPLGGSIVAGAPWAVNAAPGTAPLRQWSTPGVNDTYDHATAALTVGAAPGHQRVSLFGAIPNHPVYTLCLPVSP